MSGTEATLASIKAGECMTVREISGNTAARLLEGMYLGFIRMIETGDDQWREYVPASAVRMVEHIKGEGK